MAGEETRHALPQRDPALFIERQTLFQMHDGDAGERDRPRADRDREREPRPAMAAGAGRRFRMSQIGTGLRLYASNIPSRMTLRNEPIARAPKMTTTRHAAFARNPLMFSFPFVLY